MDVGGTPRMLPYWRHVSHDRAMRTSRGVDQNALDVKSGGCILLKAVLKSAISWRR